LSPCVIGKDLTDIIKGEHRGEEALRIIQIFEKAGAQLVSPTEISASIILNDATICCREPQVVENGIPPPIVLHDDADEVERRTKEDDRDERGEPEKAPAPTARDPGVDGEDQQRTTKRKRNPSEETKQTVSEGSEAINMEDRDEAKQPSKKPRKESTDTEAIQYVMMTANKRLIARPACPSGSNFKRFKKVRVQCLIPLSPF